MAAVVVEEIEVEVAVASITAALTAEAEAAVVSEIAVCAEVETAIPAAVATAVERAISRAIASMSIVISGIMEKVTEEVESALQNLEKEVKDTIGSQGVHHIIEAITAIPPDVVVKKLVTEANDAISPDLWVFTDPTFFRLTRLVKAIRAIEEGERPDDYDDDDCDEEKCRFFRAPKVADSSDDFIFFTVYESEKCEDGDEVYSMSAKWKKLKKLVDDPVGGNFVSQLFQEVFKSCTDDYDGHIDELSIHRGISKLGITGMPMKKIVKSDYGTIVRFGHEKVYNVCGSSKDKRSSNWLKTFFGHGYGKCGKCYIESENPVCGHTNPQQGNIVGGHLWSPELKKKDNGLYFYILPICKRHNKRIVYDKPRQDGTGWLLTSSEAYAMKIVSTSKVDDWKAMCRYLAGFKRRAVMGMVSSDGARLCSPMDEVKECHKIIQPKKLTDWLQKEINKIALEFAKGPIQTVIMEVTAIVLHKVSAIIKSAGEAAKDWVTREGFDIKLKSLIPIYGIYQAVKRLSSLKSDAMGRFHSSARSALFSYKKECLGEVEQKRRRQRLIEETNKVAASKRWKDRIVALERSVASNVSTLINL